MVRRVVVVLGRWHDKKEEYYIGLGGFFLDGDSADGNKNSLG